MTRKVITIVSADKTRMVNVAQVTHFQADEKYISTFHAGTETLLSRNERIENLSVEFSEDFIRLSRSLIVRKTLLRSLSKRLPEKNYRSAAVEGVGAELRVTQRYIGSVRALLATQAATKPEGQAGTKRIHEQGIDARNGNIERSDRFERTVC